MIAAPPPEAARAERTSPVVRPARGGPRRVFRLRFTERVAPGREAGVSQAYEVVLSRPGGGRPKRCLPAQPTPIEKGGEGERVTVALRPPAKGWCTGRYTATVYLERRPACQGPPTTLRPGAAACPLFITLSDTGEAGFRVTPPR